MTSIINSIKELALGTSDGPLFEPVKVGKYDLKVRYVYAPLTVSFLIKSFSAIKHRNPARVTSKILGSRNMC